MINEAVSLFILSNEGRSISRNVASWRDNLLYWNTEQTNENVLTFTVLYLCINEIIDIFMNSVFLLFLMPFKSYASVENVKQ